MTDRFQQELERFQEWLQGLGYSSGDWTTISVNESRLTLGGPWPSEGERWTPETFAERFDEILRIGARDWVNMTTTGVDEDGTLRVVIEYFDQPLEGRERIPAEKIHVMFSGPAPRDQHGGGATE